MKITKIKVAKWGTPKFFFKNATFKRMSKPELYFCCWKPASAVQKLKSDNAFCIGTQIALVICINEGKLRTEKKFEKKNFQTDFSAPSISKQEKKCQKVCFLLFYCGVKKRFLLKKKGATNLNV